MDLEKLSKVIVKALGGRENISTLDHCSTRLTVTLNDESLADEDIIEVVEGVQSLIKEEGKYQIIVDSKDVEVIYANMNTLLEISEEGKNEIVEAEEDKGEAEEKKEPGPISKLFNTIIGCIVPVIPVLIGCGLGKCILMIVSMLGLADADSSLTYYIFNFVFDAGFTFLPVFTAIASAQYFKCNVFMAALLGCALVHPDWSAIVSQTNPEFIGTMFGFIPVYGMSYASSIIPSMMIVYCMKLVNDFFSKYIPKILQEILVPTCTLLVMVPLTFVALGPVIGIISSYLGIGLLWIYDNFGMFAMSILCFIDPWLMATGMHITIVIAGLQLVAQMGFDPLSRVITLVGNMCEGSACLACALRTKNSEFRQTCISASITGFFSGMVEPCIYGVTLRLKKPMLAVMIGSAAGGLYAGLVALKAYVFLTPTIINFPMWLGGGSYANLINAVITIVISIVVTFVATLILGFDDPVEGSEDEAQLNAEN